MGVGVGIWQARLAREQTKIARQQAALPGPLTAGYGLPAPKLSFDHSVLGQYEGRSHSNKQTREGLEPIKDSGHIEQFTIAHNFDRVTVVGRSLDLTTRDISSRWSGGLWKIDDDGTLYFGIELTYHGEREFGTFISTIKNEKAEGFYYSGEPNTRFVSTYKAKKVDRFSA
jgi:hypothetical protein